MGSGSSVLKRDRKNRLINSIENCDYYLFKNLVEREGIMIDFMTLSSGHGLRPIHYAAIHNCPYIIKYISNKINKINLNVYDNYGWTPLHHAVINNSYEAYTTLVTLGVNQKLKTKNNYPGKSGTKNKTALDLVEIFRCYKIMDFHSNNLPN